MILLKFFFKQIEIVSLDAKLRTKESPEPINDIFLLLLIKLIISVKSFGYSICIFSLKDLSNVSTLLLIMKLVFNKHRYFL